MPATPSIATAPPRRPLHLSLNSASTCPSPSITPPPTARPSPAATTSPTSGTLTFAPGETTKTILVPTLNDAVGRADRDVHLNLSNPSARPSPTARAWARSTTTTPPSSTCQRRASATGPTSTARSASVENYAINSGNTAPRGAASTAAGDKVWVVDANKKVYVYNTSGGLLGSWTAGSLASNATVQGIATNGTDVWIVDAKQDKVFRYTGAASRLSGSQNAASSFSLNSGNTSPKGIVTDGTYLWVVNDSSTDKVFKYTLSGSLVGSWTITGAGSSPTGITLDPTSGGNLWIVDSGTDRVYQFDNAAGRTSGSQSPSTSFALAAGNTNPQGIADPPMPAPGTSQVAAPTKTSHPSAHLATHLGRTIPGFLASKSTGSLLPSMAATPSDPRPAGTPILISLTLRPTRTSPCWPPNCSASARSGLAPHLGIDPIVPPGIFPTLRSPRRRLVPLDEAGASAHFPDHRVALGPPNHGKEEPGQGAPRLPGRSEFLEVAPRRRAVFSRASLP